MADYTIISNISNYVICKLRETMCPEPVLFPAQIETVTLSDQTSDYMLGLYLYDMREEQEIQPLVQDRDRLWNNTRPYSLYYMVFVNENSGIKAADSQKIIGKAAQVIADIQVISPNDLQPWLKREEPFMAWSQIRIGLEEKTRIWQSANKPYQLSLFYKVAPVFIFSNQAVEVQRVKEAEISLTIKERK